MALPPEYKIILLGDPGIGKTTFFLRIKDGNFVDTELRPTASLGVEHLEYQHKIGGVNVKVNIHNVVSGIWTKSSLLKCESNTKQQLNCHMYLLLCDKKKPVVVQPC